MASDDSSPQDAARLPRGRRYAVRALLVVATILAVVAIFAVWADRQALNADNWADTSSALLENQDIRTQVSAFLVDQLYANVNVAGEVEEALPPRLKRLAGPAANGLRELAERRTDRALGRPRVQEAWKQANRITAQQFINIAEGKSGAITASGNAVILDLRVILTDIIRRLGLPRSLAEQIPPGAGRIQIMSSEQITTVQNGATALNSLAIVLPLLAFGSLALAVYLARGRRRQTLLFAGFDLIAAGALVLVARNVIGDSVVNSLAKTEAVEPAAEAAWSIGTRLLHDIAAATIVIGIPLVAAAWLAGPSRPAVAIRRALAPWLRDDPVLSYAVAGALLLLVIAWGPIPATRMVIPILIMIALVALGVHALRRQTAAEFPDATVDATRSRLHAAAGRAGRALGVGRGRDGAAAAAAADDRDQATASRIEQLERLEALHRSGALTDEEFRAEKTTIRSGTEPA